MFERNIKAAYKLSELIAASEDAYASKYPTENVVYLIPRTNKQHVFRNSENMQTSILQTIDVTRVTHLRNEYTWVIIWMLNLATQWFRKQNSTFLIEIVLLMYIFWSKP